MIFYDRFFLVGNVEGKLVDVREMDDLECSLFLWNGKCKCEVDLQLLGCLMKQFVIDFVYVFFVNVIDFCYVLK